MHIAPREVLRALSISYHIYVPYPSFYTLAHNFGALNIDAILEKLLICQTTNSDIFGIVSRLASQIFKLG